MKRPSRGPRSAWELLEQVAPHLGEYREHLVLIGGIAKHFYQHVEGFVAGDEPTMRTRDIDFALSDPLVVIGATRLHDRLVAAGLRARERIGLNHQPVSCTYYPQEIDRPTPLDPHLEFVVPLRGPDRDDAISRPQGDALHANPLRFVDLLLDEPWLATHPVLGTFRVPHPLAYIVQKTRMRDKRLTTGKQARDQADAFYVLMGFHRQWATWAATAERWRGRADWGSWLSHVARTWDTIYASPAAPGSNEVATSDDLRSRYTSSSIAEIMRNFRHAVRL